MASASNARQPIFAPEQDRSAGTYDDYAKHIAYELAFALEMSGEIQIELAKKIGFGSASPVSRILAAKMTLTLEKARALDQHQYETSIGATFEDLVIERDGKPRKRRVGEPRATEHDVFLAAPMAAAGATYPEVRELVLQMETALDLAGLTVYCAVNDVAAQSDFDTQVIAYETNWQAIQSCRQLVLFLPEPLVGETPSSVWVEVGMALAREMPCTFFVPKQRHLPYVVQQALDTGKKRLVRAHYFNDDPRTAIRWIRRNGAKVLSGADND